jgi:hypothetical protein
MWHLTPEPCLALSPKGKVHLTSPSCTRDNTKPVAQSRYPHQAQTFKLQLATGRTNDRNPAGPSIHNLAQPKGGTEMVVLFFLSSGRIIPPHLPNTRLLVFPSIFDPPYEDPAQT